MEFAYDGGGLAKGGNVTLYYDGTEVGLSQGPFATEERELAVAKDGKGWRVDFTSTLTALVDKVRLDGDPQHAGFHFRANSQVEKTNAEAEATRAPVVSPDELLERAQLQRLLSEPPAVAGGVLSFDQTSGAFEVGHAWFASRVDTIGTRMSAERLVRPQVRYVGAS